MGLEELRHDAYHLRDDVRSLAKEAARLAAVLEQQGVKTRLDTPEDEWHAFNSLRPREATVAIFAILDKLGLRLVYRREGWYVEDAGEDEEEG